MQTKIRGEYILAAVRYSPSVIRLKIQPKIYGEMEASLMDRLDLLAKPDELANPNVSDVNGELQFDWKDITLFIDINTMNFRVKSIKRADITGQIRFHRKKAKCEIAVSPNTHFMGLGYRKIDYLDLYGKKFNTHVTYGSAYGPQPFIYSNDQFGIYLNTTRDSYFDVGASQPDRLSIQSNDKSLDIFFFFGTPVEILGEYTSLTGKPYLMPKTGYGLLYIDNEKETQFDILNYMEHFLKEDIPCQYLGLEPGWMETKYDVTVDKKWNEERFFMPYWSDDRKQFREQTFIGALRRNGFGLSLWLCCDYDIFWAEQHRLVKEEEIEEEFDFVGKDFDVRAHTPRYQDQITKIEEPWFEHLKKFIDDGVSVFKQDPAFVANDHPDRLYAGEFTDDEIHNIYITVLARQMYEGYKAYTGERPMYYTGTGFTGIQRWSPSWTCDCGGREEALMGVLLSSLCGHMNMTVDLDMTKEGMHFGFLLPWSQINSWASMYQPWFLGKDKYETFLYYARLHDQLLPYIYSAAKVGHDTGLPIVRPLTLCYPDDSNSYQANREYMFGDSLLVGCFSHTLYLPEGEWYDFWTNEHFEGSQWIEASWPENRGGALFVKAGALIPFKDDESGKTIIHVYPGEGNFTLYEDDGLTFDYEKGKFVETEITSAFYGKDCQIKVKKISPAEKTSIKLADLEFQLQVNEANTVITTVPEEIG